MEQILVENISYSERVALDNFIFNESFLPQILQPGTVKG